MNLAIAIFLAVLGLPLLGIATGLLQVAWYRWRKTPPDDVPFFLILMLRGMVVGFALIAAATVASHVVAGR